MAARSYVTFGDIQIRPLLNSNPAIPGTTKYAQEQLLSIFNGTFERGAK